MKAFDYFKTFALIGIVALLSSCDKPTTLSNPESLIEGTWLSSPVQSDKRVRWTFSGGELRLELEQPLGTKTTVMWTKGATTKDHLTYSIKADYQVILEVDKKGWNGSPGVGTLNSVPEKGDQSKFMITELTNQVLHLSTLAESSSGTVGGEAQRGFSKE